MKKSHPFRRVMLASAATVSGIVLLLTLKPTSDPGSAQAAGALPQQTAAAQEAAQGGASAKDGTFTGDAVDTQYGPVQVRITVSGGKITKAEAVQTPSGGQSTQISGNAVPKLNQAAVAAGTADIDAVSGATYTSAGYKESLQSALDKVPAESGTGTGAGAADSAAGSADASAGAGAADSGAAEGGATSDGGGTFTGSVVQTEYGPVQVRIRLTDGRITSASAVQAPSGGRSDQISGDAIPKLNQEAVTAGDGDIDAVSGASYTSAGYKESLQSALDQAGG
ncbi:FMN-binding protein [Streptomyces sp. ADMS]|uniref:FMN-binding protein n=1 Tax=Streptomyces sp. ADMS TaxID=3071415 RepID=UPI00296E616A|nr:FMN-binding protein [Streptomyces sp. ADMS]MDW4906857.1 FMN-binding protein [Streptomyces sp. ADMS]